MSTKLPGDKFDIHGWRMDLKFPTPRMCDRSRESLHWLQNRLNYWGCMPIADNEGQRMSKSTGEFADLKLLADWAEQTKLSMLQILPINDTTATHQWKDSYPYAAISVYALHPQYLSLENLTCLLSDSLNEEYKNEKKRLNLLPQVDYEAVMNGKLKYLKAIFNENKNNIFIDKNFQNYHIQNSNCKWKILQFYKLKKQQVLGFRSQGYATVIFHIWVQYQLHLQLTAAVDYIHSKGLAIKGDLPIGIYRHSVEAWTEPELFGMDFQAGAPPDEFTDLGQNWEFPTYNWEVMKENAYQIWRMPASAVQGILGSFYPAIPVTTEELEDKKIGFDRDRYCKPFINDEILQHVLGDLKNDEINIFFIKDNELYHFRPEYDTQKKIEAYFKEYDDSLKIKDKIYYLLS
ncbi:hypothetical protein FQR65_LT18247 [Abscondita terminalis]|nr:hypothetical protein FQR65_LT18247 [Abscondita terminalis]